VSYAAERLVDVQESVGWLRERWPQARVLVLGLCSGAYYAVQAGPVEMKVDAIVAVNPQLYWRPGMPTQLGLDDLAPAVEMQLAQGMERAMRDGRKWRRLLRGGYAWRDVARGVRGAATRFAPTAVTGVADSSLLGGRLPRLDVERLFPGTVPTHLVFSDDDFGLPYLQAHGPAFRRVVARGHARIHVLPDCDHTCSRERMRERLDPLLFALLGEG
jgi:hypothetical protein